MINMNNIHIKSISPVVKAFPNAKNALLGNYINNIQLKIRLLI